MGHHGPGSSFGVSTLSADIASRSSPIEVLAGEGLRKIDPGDLLAIDPEVTDPVSPRPPAGNSVRYLCGNSAVDGSRDAVTVHVVGIGVLGPLSTGGTAAFGRRDRAVLTALAMCVGEVGQRGPAR